MHRRQLILAVALTAVACTGTKAGSDGGSPADAAVAPTPGIGPVCSSRQDCAATPSTADCDPSIGRCVEFCTSSTQCSVPGTLCNPTAGYCVPTCVTAMDCAGAPGTPNCDVLDHVCVSTCPDGEMNCSGVCTTGACPTVTPDAGPGVDGGLPADAGDAGPHADAGDAGPHPDAGDAGPVCMPRSCEEARASCGPASDGCGTLLACGTCDAGTCGGGGTPSMCGSGVTCLPRSCRAAGANCGSIGDGCGAVVVCGGCDGGSVCGAEAPNVCGGTTVSPCTGLCQQQVTCAGGATTTITGKVYAPTPSTYGSPDPLFNALVYVPNAPLVGFAPGIACETCGVPVSGNPLVTTNTAADGSFTLQNVPAGTSIPLVIQLGRWRRYVEIPTVTACVDNMLTDPDMTRLPRTQFETSQWDNIPAIAMVTGSADPLECVLRKIGIADSEFTTPTGTVAGSSPPRPGRVQMYLNNGAQLAADAGVTPSADDLTGDAGVLSAYDMVIFACDGETPGSGFTPTAAEQTNVINYANSGGRVFATHYSYAWLYNDQPFEGTASWTPNAGSYDTVTAVVNQTFADGLSFAQWLLDVGASTTLGTIDLTQARNDFSAVVTSETQLYLTATGTGILGGTTTFPLQYTFSTPVGVPASSQCGRVLYSDFHVNSSGGTSGVFPAECASDTGGLSAQEKALEYLLFDLSSCVGAPAR